MKPQQPEHINPHVTTNLQFPTSLRSSEAFRDDFLSLLCNILITHNSSCQSKLRLADSISVLQTIWDGEAATALILPLQRCRAGGATRPSCRHRGSPGVSFLLCATQLSQRGPLHRATCQASRHCPEVKQKPSEQGREQAATAQCPRGAQHKASHQGNPAA